MAIFSILFFINDLEASLKIAVVDTGFCVHSIHQMGKRQKITGPMDMTQSPPQKSLDSCKKLSQKQISQSPRFHGQKLLNEFLSYLPKTIDVTIYPLIVYDQKGQQTALAWRNALDFISQQKMDLVLTASGFITDDKLVDELPSLWFVPSGRVGPFITKETKLFPQNLAPRPNLLLIGDYFYDKNTPLYDQQLLYQEQIDYYFPSGDKEFQGTSRAVAEAMARAISKCLVAKNEFVAHLLRLCLLKHEKSLIDPLLKKDFKTF